MALSYVKKTTSASTAITSVDGTPVDVKELGASKALATVIIDSSGNEISQFGSTTQYTEGAVDPTIVGTAALMEIEGNTLKPLGGFGLTDKNALAVAIVDGDGAQISSFGGGTQYTEGSTDASITGTAVLMEGAGNTLVPFQGNSTDGLLVNLGGNNDVTITSSALPTGAATAARQDTVIGHIDGIETVLSDINTKTEGFLNLRMDTSGAITYVGKAAIGSSSASALWQIKKIDETSGTVITWADGNSNFDNIWDNRASLTYS